MLDDLITTVIIMNMVLCVIIVVWDTYFYFKVNETERWAKVLYISVAVAWFVRYILYFLNYDGFGSANPQLLIINTFTLTALAVGSVIRVQRIHGTQDMWDDMKKLARKVRSWIPIKR